MAAVDDRERLKSARPSTNTNDELILQKQQGNDDVPRCVFIIRFSHVRKRKDYLFHPQIPMYKQVIKLSSETLFLPRQTQQH